MAASEYMRLTEEETVDLATLIDSILRQIERLDDLSIPELEVKYRDRDKGYRPTAEEDPYNAFIRKCRVEGAPRGKLTGKTVGLKDNIRLAGIPMTNASRLMHEYVPSIDATVAERLLDAGATIVGKLNMDNFSMGGTSETSDFGAPRNPHNSNYSTGGSSGGSGAALAAGLVDIAIGVDEGGSARIPASWCGVVCMKATHGLVPSFGITYLDHTIDFVCPMAASVEDVALALEAIAGNDPKDPQWVRGSIPTDEYSKALNDSISGFTGGRDKGGDGLARFRGGRKRSGIDGGSLSRIRGGHGNGDIHPLVEGLRDGSFGSVEPLSCGHGRVGLGGLLARRTVRSRLAGGVRQGAQGRKRRLSTASESADDHEQIPEAGVL